MGSFEALYEHLLAKFPDEKARGTAFEEICQLYLRTLPALKKELKKVWLWDAWPDRFGPDTGIDLVAQTHDGDLWAIQAKAWNPERTRYNRGEMYPERITRLEALEGWD